MHRQTAPRLPWTWGSTEGLEAPARISDASGPRWRLASRAVETTASPESLYLWICQLRRAPYSYDWIDNFGRQSPRTPDTTLTELAVGQPVMLMFRVTEFEPNRSLTVEIQRGWPARVFGYVMVRYAAVPIDADRTLLRCDFWMPRTGGPIAWLRRYLLAWGDLVMMRKQLGTLSKLAEAGEAETNETEEHPATATSGTPDPGERPAGKPTAGKPTAGKSTPGKSTPGKSSAGRSTAGKSTQASSARRSSAASKPETPAAGSGNARTQAQPDRTKGKPRNTTPNQSKTKPGGTTGGTTGTP